MRSIRFWNGLAAALLVAATAGCWWEDPVDPPEAPDPVTIDFEGFTAFDIITDQFASQGVVFSGTAAIDTSQVDPALIEPHSGVGMAWNCPNFFCDALVADFPDGASNAGAHVTGLEVVTLTCFDAAGTPLGSASTPGRNVIGNPDGFQTNVLVEVTASGIARCSFQSAQIDRSFTIDDFTFTPES